MEQEKTKPIENAVPDSGEIDALLSLYLDADKNVDDAIERRNVFGEQVEQLIKKHGFLPPRATKSKRIQGEEYRATLSPSHSVNVDGTAVLRFFDLLKQAGLGPWFRKLFRREEVFVLRENAHALFASLLTNLEKRLSAGAVLLPVKSDTAKLQVLFSRTLKIEDRSSSLKVEPIKKEKEA